MSGMGRTLLILGLALCFGLSLLNTTGCGNCGAIGGVGGGNENCGAIVGITPTPTPVGGTPTQASLSGSYAFQLWGIASGGTFYGAVGSFHANGSGSITGGSVDISSTNPTLTSQPNIAITGGSYTITSSGVGSVNLTLTNAAYDMTLGIVLISPQNALINRIDSATTNAAVVYGTAALQFPGDFTLTNNAYVFSALGINGSQTQAHAGVFTTDNNGNILSGVEDINNGGTTNQAVPIQSNSLTASQATASTGRITGQITNGGTIVFSAVFYIVDSTHLMLLETGPSTNAAAVGEAYQQGFVSTTTPNDAALGGYVFNLLTTEAAAPFSLAGQAVFNGSGNITSGVLDSNTGGTVTLAAPLTPSSYSIAASGRGTMVLSSSLGNMNFSIYPSIAGLTMIEMDSNSGIANMFPQDFGSATSFSNSSVQGSYAANFIGGFSGGKSVGAFSGVAQLSANGAGLFTGATFSADNNGNISSVVPGSGSYASINATTGRGTIQLISTALPGGGSGGKGSSTSGTINGVVYVIGPPNAFDSGFLFIETDTGQYAKGQAFPQGGF